MFIVIYKLKGTLETEKVVKDYDWKFLSGDQLGRIFFLFLLYCYVCLVFILPYICLYTFFRSGLTIRSCGQNSCDLATAAGVSFIMKLWEEAEVESAI